MPTSYTTTVTVDGFGSANYGQQLDSLEITSGSTNPYELPQPPSARASFLGLPVVSGVTQTPDWWIGKKLTFTISPQGATGTVTWAGIVQGYNCSPVQTSSADQIVELDLLGQTSRLSTEIIAGAFSSTMGFGPDWSQMATVFNNQLAKTSWDEVPAGLTWDKATGTWDTFTNNKSGLTFVNDTVPSGAFVASNVDFTGQDLLSTMTTMWTNKHNGWFWFDDTTVTLNIPNPNGTTGYLNYTQLNSLDASTCVLWSSLNASQSFSNIVNSGRMTHVNGTDVFEYLDSASYDANGYRFQDFGTAYDADGLYIALGLENKVKAYKGANKYLQSLTINLDAMTHTTSQWQNFYKSTKPVRLPITNIPSAYGGNHTYMVRGVQLNLTQKHAEATLLVVPSTIYNPA